jgi:effector-binding domain-containing protein
MLSEPEVIERQPQPYAAIRSEVTMDSIGTVLPALLPQVFQWLGERGIAPAGAPFWKYDVIDMAAIMVVEVAVPTAELVAGDDKVQAGTIPAGRYATLRYTGHPSGLIDATGLLLKWAGEQNLTWDMVPTPDGDRWEARLEIYETDPATEPDMTKWTTQLAFRLAD